MSTMKARFILVRTPLLTKVDVRLPPQYVYMAQAVKEGENIFFRKVFDKRQNFPSLVQRILREVQDSIEIGMNIAEHVPQAKIELHLDISPAYKNNGTSKISEMVTGYAKASGFDCKIKPDAWASQSVADKHSK